MRKLSLIAALTLICPLFIALLANSPTAHAIGEAVDMTTQHNNNQRTGANLNETYLNTTNVNAASFGKLFAKPVDGQIYTQPLYLSNMNIGGKIRNVVFVATMHNTVYCFDADDGSAGVLWSRTLDTSVKLPDTNIGQQPYKDILVEIGILSTPVISRADNAIYVLTMTYGTAANTYQHKLYALDLTTGNLKFNSPTKIAATSVGSGVNGAHVSWNSYYQSQRSALTLANGRVYFGSASFGVFGPYHGWVLGYNATTLQQEVVYNVTPNASWGGVWMSGQGLTVDATGNLYFVTGNGPGGETDSDTNHSDSVVKLSKDSPAQVLDWFTPYNAKMLEAQDLDLGSSGAMLIPGTNLIINGSKEGKLYLLNTLNLGKFHAGSDSQIVQSFKVSTGNIHGAPIYWEGPNGKYIYVWGEEDNLKAFSFNGARISSEIPSSKSAVKLGIGKMPGGFLTVSANGNKAGTGIVWSSTPLSDDANKATVEGIVRAYDASDLSKELWNSKQNDARDHLGNFAKFAPPTVANGKVYMATFSGYLNVYGLLNGSNSPSPTPTPTPIGTATKYEAENATLLIAKKATDHTNYSGTGFVDGYITNNVGASTTFNVTSATAGVKDVLLRYGNGSGVSRTLSIYVNGVKIKQTTLPVTTNWDTWADQIEKLTLKAGSNTITYKYDSGDTANVNLDYISLPAASASPTPIPTATPIPTITPVPTATPIPTITPVPTATPIPTITPVPTTTPIPTITPAPTAVPGAIKYEAENAVLLRTTKATDHLNFSGTSFVANYVTLNVGAATTFTVNAATAGSKAVDLRYANGTGVSRTLSIYVNGTKIKQTNLPATLNWDTWGDVVEALTLNAGNNTIAYKYDNGDTANVNLDYISLGGATPVPTSTPPPTATPLPTASPLPTLTPAPTATPLPTPTPQPGTTKYEAENAALLFARTATDHANYSGTSFVANYTTLNVGATTTFTVSSAAAGAKAVTLRYANGTGIPRTLTIYVNGVKIKQTTLAATTNWDTWSNQAETLMLSAGNNTIAYRYDVGDTANVNVDYILL